MVGDEIPGVQDDLAASTCGSLACEVVPTKHPLTQTLPFSRAVVAAPRLKRRRVALAVRHAGQARLFQFQRRFEILKSGHFSVVAGGGLEPPTSRLSIACSAD